MDINHLRTNPLFNFNAFSLCKKYSNTQLFMVFGLNTEMDSVNLYIQFKPRIQRPEKAVFGYTFHAVYSILLRLLRNTGIQANFYDVTFSQNI